MTRTLLAVCAATSAMALALPGAASAGIFGTDPINISVTPSGGEANGSSGGPAVSGDNRKTRLAAFHSDASNLVGGDSNDATDVFVWSRPRGGQGISLPRGAGSLQRVSVTNGGGQANGASHNPSLDGSITNTPHCVAFESTASNLAPGDRDSTSDVFVRDLRSRKTLLVSRAISAAASNPSIAGSCRNVAFEAGGRVLVAAVKGGKVRAIGAGHNPDYSLDGSAIVWEKGAGVAFTRNGRASLVAASGKNPTVSDAERLAGSKSSYWGVSFETRSPLSGRDRNPGYDMYMRVLGSTGGTKRTDLISAPTRGAGSLGGDSFNGGITAYAPNRGILTFTNTQDDATTMYYRNNNSGNIDDLAHSAATGGEPGIAEVQTSARANFIAFSSAYTGSLASPFSGLRECRRRCELLPTPTLDSLFSSNRNIYFKHLIDGESV